MKETNLVLEKLEEIQKYNGIWGVIFAIFFIVCFLLLWKYLTKSIEFKAVIEYNKSLEKFKSELQSNIGIELVKQQAIISKDITSYKSELDKELSKLTAELSIANSAQIEVKNEERRAILDYLNSHSEWLYGSLEIQILNYKYQNFEDINNKLSEINQSYSKTNISINKMQFWTTNSNLITLALELNKKTLNLSHFVQSKLGTLRHNLSWGKMYSDSFQKIITDFESHKEYARLLAIEDKKIQDENDELYTEFWKVKLELYGEVLKVNSEFQSVAKNYLNKIE